MDIYDRHKDKVRELVAVARARGLSFKNAVESSMANIKKTYYK